MPITEYKLSNNLSLDIQITSKHQLLIPEYEVREAAIFAHYNWLEWLELDGFDRALAVAHYRLHHLIESNIQDEVAKRTRQQQSVNG